MKLKYDNIAISGSVAVGKNTLFENLKPYLQPLGFNFRTTGQILREHTQEFVMPVASLVSDNFHTDIETKTREILEHEKNWVIEGWLAGWRTRDLKHVLKVLLVCSIDEIRIDRVVNRDKITIQKAREYVKKRESDNFDTWKKIYGDYNFFSPEYYDLIIDTVDSGPLETVGKVLDRLGYQNKNKQDR